VTPRLLSTIGGMRIAIPPPRKRRGSPCYIFMTSKQPLWFRGFDGTSVRYKLRFALLVTSVPMHLIGLRPS
jgi:hypothetical protein